MTGQYYRADCSWDADQWPMELSAEQMAILNKITPHTWTITQRDGTTKVERYAYIGEGADCDDIGELVEEMSGDI